MYSGTGSSGLLQNQMQCILLDPEGESSTLWVVTRLRSWTQTSNEFALEVVCLTSGHTSVLKGASYGVLCVNIVWTHCVGFLNHHKLHHLTPKWNVSFFDQKDKQIQQSKSFLQGYQTCCKHERYLKKAKV